ncbi:MAG: transcription antitermination factor NusB [Bacteroidota bacterium]|nr:transcription antitermination factor NusB [Bacteroidota bacterium]MDP4234269.1 transcription antitermination factor NusB [Bacteroidota bacterium]MDP4243459.1 transcription antitermination factor NusB [Bacteroidota bacterium]MDP4289161.1 transcription antitermination factor NusB [Bacteroidota bacterium]
MPQHEHRNHEKTEDDARSDHGYYPREPIEPARIESGEIFDNDPERDRRLPRRRLARERVLQILYANELSGRDLDELFFDLAQQDLSVDTAALTFGRDLVREFTVHREQIDKLIHEKLTHWDFRRVALLDRLLIQMGIAELLCFPDIPPKATINELIEIAKDYSTEESGKFINGILHAVMTELQKTGELKKTGRGLIDRGLNDREDPPSVDDPHTTATS